MEIVTALEAVGAALDELASVDLTAASGSTLRSSLTDLKVSESKLLAQLARFTHASDSSGAFIGTGARDSAEWLGKETGTSTRRNRTAAQLGEAMSKSEQLADAVTSGRLSSDKASAAVGAAGDLPVDADLLDRIGDLPLPSVRPTTEAWRARSDADRDLDIAEAQRARRFLRLTGQADGMTRVDGLLDPMSAAVVRTTLDAVMNESAFDQSRRTRDQRCADALTQLAKAASKGEIAGGRSNAKILATVPFETIVERAGARGVTHAGPTLDAASVRTLACDAGIHRVITGPASSILDFGREKRMVSENLFLALVARDAHCRWPGCAIRATWCDAHHVTEWGHDGRTDEESCALLCDHHHRVTHQPGWTVTGTGREFTIRHPDGTTEVSRLPARSTARHPSDDSSPTLPFTGTRSGASPPDVLVLRADSIGGTRSISPARPHATQPA